MKQNAVQVIEFLLYFFCFCPFIKLLPIETDTQPYALLFAVMYIYLNGVMYGINSIFLKKEFLLILFAFCFFCISNLFSDDIHTISRSLFTYLSMGIISIAIYISCLRNKGLKEQRIKLFIILWLIVGIIQILYDRFFLSFIISNMRTSFNRGVCSLASEPSYYGYMLFFFAILITKFKTGKYIFLTLVIFQLLFIAQSSVGLVYFILWGSTLIIYLTISTKKLQYIYISLLVLVLIPLGINTVNEYMPNSRLNILLNKFLSSNADVMLEDASINTRVEHILFSLEAFFNNLFFPHGFISYIGSQNGRINSGYGTFLYEFGILSVFYVIYYYKIFKCAFDFSTAFVISIIMFSAIQLANPLFCFILGFSLYNYCTKNGTQNFFCHNSSL